MGFRFRAPERDVVKSTSRQKESAGKNGNGKLHAANYTKYIYSAIRSFLKVATNEIAIANAPRT